MRLPSILFGFCIGAFLMARLEAPVPAALSCDAIPACRPVAAPVVAPVAARSGRTPGGLTIVVYDPNLELNDPAPQPMLPWDWVSPDATVHPAAATAGWTAPATAEQASDTGPRQRCLSVFGRELGCFAFVESADP